MSPVPKLRVVEQVAATTGKRTRSQSPDAQARRLLQTRRDLLARLRQVDFDLFEHRRRKATERGQLPPLTIEQLAVAVDL